MTSSFEADYYRQNYPNYLAQNPPRKMRFYAQMIERHVPATGPRCVHDLGCAFGRFVGSLDESWAIFGSDVSNHAIEQARSAHPRGKFAVIDGSGSPSFGDRKFGVVTAFDVIEHIPDLGAVAASVCDQLVDGGAFVFVVPVYDGASGPIIRRLDKDPTHIHKWSREAWLDWAAKLFDVVEWQGILRFLLPGGYYLHVPTRLFRRHTPAILVACRRRVESSGTGR